MTRRERWVAPEEDGGILVDPPLERVEELLETNRRRLEKSSVRLLDLPLAEVRRVIRDNAVDLSDEHRKLNGSVIATGHQPELFHPGVWLKNFAVCGLARRHGRLPVHIQIDTDTIKTTSLRFPDPGPDPVSVNIHAAAFDEWAGEEPSLFRPVRDQELCRNFSEATAPIWKNWPFQPLLPRFWQNIEQSLDREQELRVQFPSEYYPPSLNLLIEGATNQVELDWNCRNTRLWLFLMDSGRIFAGHILADLPRFHSIYNESLHRYRRTYGLRSHSHPAPDLSVDGEYLEAPFWWFDVQTSPRSRLFARSDGDIITLRRGLRGNTAQVRLQQDDEPITPPDFGHGYILTRALTTTMFLRLCVADLFIHGIGGAKYDEVTDDIIRRYFGIEPPEYMVVSGTLRLPFPLFPATADERRRLQRRLRDLRWCPEQYLDADSGLAEQKRCWIERQPLTRDEKRARYRELLGLTEALRPHVAGQIMATESQLARCDQELAANAILSRRDYPFVLYPEEKLRRFLTQLL